jgi:HlyD family secretion protein
VLLAGIAGAAYAFVRMRDDNGSDHERYRFDAVTRGNLTQVVSANGTLQPVNVVSVGTQVSGTVKKLYVDFNDKVEQGQVLLELDNSIYSAQVRQSEANLRNAQASLELARANAERMRGLFAKEYVSKQELDQAEQALTAAQAQISVVRAQMDRDRANLGYTVIRSPVSGVVVDRVVAVGQTVAASLQTPTLIMIAQDLSKMQINSSFAEADIGRITPGLTAQFKVDAFPDRQFEGIVKQVRLNPTTVQNVVTYNVVVMVDNPGEILLPGMTAYVNVRIAEKKDVLLVPSSALRVRVTSGPQGEHQGPRRGGAGPAVHVLRNGQLIAVPVKPGAYDSYHTEIVEGDLRPGEEVVIGERSVDRPASGGGTQQRQRRFRGY